MKGNTPSFASILKARLHKKDFLYEFFCKGKKTLDLGCGSAGFLKNDPQMITGVDVNTDVITDLKTKGFNVEIATADKLPFADGSFDAIHCRNVIEHLGVDEAYHMIKEASRVLRKGGTFVLCSEMVTKKFWGTFGHIKPYPPGAIIKLLRAESGEEFSGIRDLEYAGVIHIGNYFRNKILYLISAAAGYYIPSLFAREYFLVLRKK